MMTNLGHLWKHLDDFKPQSDSELHENFLVMQQIQFVNYNSIEIVSTFYEQGETLDLVELKQNEAAFRYMAF